MALDSRAREALRIGDSLFSKKRNLDSLHQELALNFYPERADFTTTRNEGDEYADHLFTSFPAMARRELGNVLSSSLRPPATKWFSIHVDDEVLDDQNEERRFLEFLTEIQWDRIYGKQTLFVQATKQADHDFVTFGNAVIWYGLNMDGDGLLFKNYHLRDCAWAENGAGVVDCMHRNWEPTSKALADQFPATISSEVKKFSTKDPDKKIKCRHVVLPTRLYDFKSARGRQFPYVSLIVERETETVLEEVGFNYFPYVVPRWHTLSGSPYGTSMATGVILPDGRSAQVIMRTTLEAGEKYVDPPMLALGDAIRGDMALYAGGVTIADIESDGKLSEVLRPIAQDKNGMPIAFEISAALRDDIRTGFFLDKIQLPDFGGDMTAFETARRIEDRIRAQAPIFEPIEKDYNDPLMDGVFTLMRDNGMFPLDQMPESLAGTDIQFSFRSPLADMADQRETGIYTDVVERIIKPAAEVDPAQLENFDLTAATRDAAKAAGWKASWTKPKEAVEQRRQQLAAQQQQAAELAQANELGATVEQGGKAAQSVVEALQGQ